MDPQLLEILACPDTHHAPLTHDSAGPSLTCTECGRVFPIVDGIPVLLLEEAEQPDQPAPEVESGLTNEPGPASGSTPTDVADQP